MSSDEDFGAPPGQVRSVHGPPPPPKTTLGVKVFWALVIVGFGAAGYGALKTYIDQRAVAERLEVDGVETEADVDFATEITRRRSPTYHELQVSYEVDGREQSAEVLDCDGARYEGSDNVRVVYVPGDPEIVRLAGCKSSFDTDVLPGILGVVFVALTLFLLWRTKGMWRN